MAQSLCNTNAMEIIVRARGTGPRTATPREFAAALKSLGSNVIELLTATILAACRSAEGN